MSNGSEPSAETDLGGSSLLPTSRGGDPSRCPRGCHQNSNLHTWLGSQGRNPALTWFTKPGVYRAASSRTFQNGHYFSFTERLHTGVTTS